MQAHTTIQYSITYTQLFTSFLNIHSMSDVPGSSSFESMSCKFGIICGRDFDLADNFILKELGLNFLV